MATAAAHLPCRCACLGCMQQTLLCNMQRVSRFLLHKTEMVFSCQDCCCTGSSVPSGYSGSGLASVSGLGSRPSHSMDVTRPAVGDAQRFAAQVCLTAQLRTALLLQLAWVFSYSLVGTQSILSMHTGQQLVPSLLCYNAYVCMLLHRRRALNTYTLLN